MTDLHDKYLKGVGDLLQAISPTEADYLNVLTLQGRLAQEIAEIRQYGPTDNTRVEIARVTTELNRICLDRLGKSFHDLCGIESLAEEPKEAKSPLSMAQNIIDIDKSGTVTTKLLKQKSKGRDASNTLVNRGEILADEISQDAESN